MPPTIFKSQVYGKKARYNSDVISHNNSSVDEVADALKNGKTVSELIDEGYKVSDIVKSVRKSSVLKPQDLLDELAASGVKYTPEDIVMITKNVDGTLMWLQTGSERAGLTHIIEISHAADLANKGVTDIPQFIDDLLKLDPIDVGRNAQGLYAKYIVDWQTYTLAYGDKGVFMFNLLNIKNYQTTRDVILKNLETEKEEIVFDDATLLSYENFEFMEIGKDYDCKILLFGDINSDGEDFIYLKNIQIGKKLLVEIMDNNKNIYYFDTIQKFHLNEILKIRHSRKDLVEVNGLPCPDYR